MSCGTALLFEPQTLNRTACTADREKVHMYARKGNHTVCSRALCHEAQFLSRKSWFLAVHNLQVFLKCVNCKSFLQLTNPGFLQFVGRYTSEDNYAASELMLKDAVALEQQRSWVHEHANDYNRRQKLLLENGPRQQDATLNMMLSTLYDERQSLIHMVGPRLDAHG